jgi:ATPase subunit of ABC transporter with duplicated ATPase domains
VRGEDHYPERHLNLQLKFASASIILAAERLRAALARGLSSTQRPELMMLDEPTNNLDLVNIELLEQVVSDFHGALVVISHGEDFLKNCGISHELVVSFNRSCAVHAFQHG